MTERGPLPGVPVGVIRLGAMGGPIAANFARAGEALSVRDVSENDGGSDSGTPEGGALKISGGSKRLDAIEGRGPRRRRLVPGLARSGLLAQDPEGPREGYVRWATGQAENR